MNNYEDIKLSNLMGNTVELQTINSKGNIINTVKNKNTVTPRFYLFAITGYLNHSGMASSPEFILDFEDDVVRNIYFNSNETIPSEGYGYENIEDNTAMRTLYLTPNEIEENTDPYVEVTDYFYKDRLSNNVSENYCEWDRIEEKVTLAWETDIDQFTGTIRSAVLGSEVTNEKDEKLYTLCDFKANMEQEVLEDQGVRILWTFDLNIPKPHLEEE